MKVVKTYLDSHRNRAEIELHENRPAFCGDTIKGDCYRLVLYADYDGGFVYHVSCYETLADAENELKKYSDFIK